MGTVKFTTLANQDGSKSIPVDRVTQGVAAAWVNFNGTGTVAIRAAYNVSSITDNGVGDYTLNFTNALPDANYAETYGSTGASSLSLMPSISTANFATYKTAASLRIQTYTVSSTLQDLASVSAACFR